MSFVAIADWNGTQLDDENSARVASLYEQKFSCPPQWIVRCPGRVNLIGEHIDYSGYSVLPMAIRVATFVAVGCNDQHQLNFENGDSLKYRSASCEVNTIITMDALNGPPQWFHYFIAGWRGALENIFAVASRPFDTELIKQISGLNVAVLSSVPPSAGLSSSSALVCAATLATLAAQTNREALTTLDRRELAEIATKAEHFVGTEGGGMDQACECLAAADFALRIDFHPLACASVRLPSNALFFVAHSGVEMNKAATFHYNRRVVECRLAAQILCKKAGKFNGDSAQILRNVRTLRDAAAAFGVVVGGEDYMMETNPSTMLSHVFHYLSNPNGGSFTRSELLEILKIEDEEFVRCCLNANTTDMQNFELLKRARHVYLEAGRVLEFQRTCKSAADGKSDEKTTLAELARLMQHSHTSCRDDFECSCPELDSLVDACRKAGCLAARLTGAGFGGCVVALVDSADRAKIETRAHELNILFWTEPSEGIKAFQVNKLI